MKLTWSLRRAKVSNWLSKQSTGDKGGVHGEMRQKDWRKVEKWQQHVPDCCKTSPVDCNCPIIVKLALLDRTGLSRFGSIHAVKLFAWSWHSTGSVCERQAAARQVGKIQQVVVRRARCLHTSIKSHISSVRPAGLSLWLFLFCSSTSVHKLLCFIELLRVRYQCVISL